MEHLVDARGLACPLPLVRARAALPLLADGDALVVLATDREAPVDIGALAADHGMTCTTEHTPDGTWRLTLRRRD
jgi:tRNA 2-thiouridine synthesizing protein A